jgi:hypothetical protein
LFRKRHHNIKGRPRRAVLRIVVFLALFCTAVWSSRSAAVDIAFERLLLGNPWSSVIDDTTMYGRSWARLGGTYWDLYHERRNNTLHDYQQNTMLLSVVYRSGLWMLGADLQREHLSLQQENVYTDNDKLDGNRYRTHALGMAGLCLDSGGYPFRIRTLELVAGAGSDGEFTGFVEAGIAVDRWVSLLVKGETFSTRLETEEQVSGYAFPFHFPGRTDRVFARADVWPEGDFRVRMWGAYTETSGDGDAVSGLENRIYHESAAAGLAVDHGLRLAHRLQVVPRLTLRPVSLVPFRLQGEYGTGRGDLGMRYNGTRYLLLDGVKTEKISVRLDVVPRSWFAPYLGWERLAVSHNGQSFFDIWPFVIWDVFTSKRYRIGEFDGNLDTWFAGLGGLMERGPTTFEWSGRFEWWQSSADLVWFERIDIVFPFFFDYEQHNESPELNPRYAVQLDAVLDLDIHRWARFRLSGRATVPFGDSGDDPAPPGGGGGGPPQTPPDTGDMTHGGLTATLEWITGF